MLCLFIGAALARQSLDLGGRQTALVEEKLLDASGDMRKVQAMLGSGGAAHSFSAVLIPLGWKDHLPPGLPELWDEYLRVELKNADTTSRDVVEGLIAVEEVADFSRGSIAELFLAAPPVAAFFKKNILLVLSDQGDVQIVDCRDPHQPRLSGVLPYHDILHMVMEGDVAYLMVGQASIAPARLIIADLSRPLIPEPLAEIELPKDAINFSLEGRQLVVYTNSKGFKGEHRLHLYNLSSDYQLTSLGSAESPFLGSRFIRYDDYLINSDLRSGLHVYNVKNPLKPHAVAEVDFPGRVKFIARYRSLVFALDQSNNVYITDFQDPESPVLRRIIPGANHSAYLIVHGHSSYYLTLDGYLRVFDVSLSDLATGAALSNQTVRGELFPSQTGTGFTLLGNLPGTFPKGITDLLPPPGSTNVIDTALWQGFLVLLGEDGSLWFYSRNGGTSTTLQGSLELPAPQRWLAAGRQRLYVGGDSPVNIVSQGADGNFIITAELDLTGRPTWDGLVVEQQLLLAAGKAGVLSFALSDPDSPVAKQGWSIPHHLQSQVDAKQLVASGDQRIFVAAGPVGLLSGQLEEGAILKLDGLFSFSEPVRAVALLGGLSLISTGEGVYVVDTSDPRTAQTLGKISLANVERFVVAPGDFWAAYNPAVGWHVRPSPVLVPRGRPELLENFQYGRIASNAFYKYRLNLYNNIETIPLPGIVSVHDKAGESRPGVFRDGL